MHAYTLRGKANVKETLLLLAFSMINVTPIQKQLARDTRRRQNWTLAKNWNAFQNTNSSIVAARAWWKKELWLRMRRLDFIFDNTSSCQHESDKIDAINLLDLFGRLFSFAARPLCLLRLAHTEHPIISQLSPAERLLGH
jgi:hypothetical protein